MSEDGYTPPDTALLGDEHVRRYEETRGEVGYLWNGATCLVLTTKGRRTGLERKFALIFAQDGDDCVVVASKGGAPAHPGWYRNVEANPEVTIQVADRTMKAVARTATGHERERLWELVNRQWPNYAVYATRTEREIPVVVLHPVPG
jgi:deazaflavin-dependent oxidoreductase (nitroreductase family)